MSAPHRPRLHHSTAMRAAQRTAGRVLEAAQEARGPAACRGQSPSEHLASALRVSAPDPAVWFVCLRGRPDAWVLQAAAVAAVADAAAHHGGATGAQRHTGGRSQRLHALGQRCAHPLAGAGVAAREGCVGPVHAPDAHWPGQRLLQADGCAGQEPPPPATVTKSRSFPTPNSRSVSRCLCVLFVPDACLCLLPCI
jgi:hypothetical protein